MSITPISGMAMLQNSPLKAAGGAVGADMPFRDVFQQALRDVEETQSISTQDSQQLALGEVDVDDLAMIQINSLKAEYAVQTLISLRDKALDAYSEIMRINV